MSISITYKVPRLLIKGFEFRGKRYLDEISSKILLQDESTIAEEKLDGKQVSIRIDGYIIMCEDLKFSHTIYYTDLPSRYYCFDVFRNGKLLDPIEKHIIILEYSEYDLFPSRIITHGPFTEESIKQLLFTKSAFGSMLNPKMKNKIREGIAKKEIKLKYINPNSKGFIEGIVLKNYKSGIIGKVVNPDFETIIGYVGRYDRYLTKNIITYWSREKTKEYLMNNFYVLSEVCENSSKLSELEKTIENYIKKF